MVSFMDRSDEKASDGQWMTKAQRRAFQRADITRSARGGSSPTAASFTENRVPCEAPCISDCRRVRTSSAE
jgi:hypothetical protein